MYGVPEPSLSLLRKVQSSQRPPVAPMGVSDTGRPQPAETPMSSSNSVYSADSGGLSAAGFGTSPLSQNPGDHVARLIQRISPGRNTHKMAEGHQGG